MNELPKATRAAIKDLLANGNSYRQIASALGIVKNTVMRYAKLYEVSALCGCGVGAGHRGWCWYRFQFSPQRQGYMADAWGARSNRRIAQVVRAAANRATKNGHTVGPFLWGSQFAANLGYAKCLECGAHAYLKRNGQIDGRLIELDCLTMEARIGKRQEQQEKRSWRDGKRTLHEVKRLLRSRSRSAVSTQAHSSPL